jgi:hypothetical protein
VARTWALVVNGDDAAKHRANVSLALDTLAALGVDADRLVVLSGGPESPQAGPPARYLAPTWEGLAAATRDLAKTVDGDDTLVVYTTGHGTWDGGVPVLVLAGETVSARELARRVLAIPFGRLVFIADQCYAGAFVGALGRSGRQVVAITSTDAAHEVLCTFFARPFWRALARRADAADRESLPLPALREAFDAAVESQRTGSPRDAGRAQFLVAGLGGGDGEVSGPGRVARATRR